MLEMLATSQLPSLDCYLFVTAQYLSFSRRQRALIFTIPLNGLAPYRALSENTPAMSDTL